MYIFLDIYTILFQLRIHELLIFHPWGCFIWAKLLLQRPSNIYIFSPPPLIWFFQEKVLKLYEYKVFGSGKAFPRVSVLIQLSQPLNEKMR